MATKADFTAEKWNQLLGSVMMAGMAVTLADPSGLIGMTKEGLASGSAFVTAKTNPSECSRQIGRVRLRDFRRTQGGARHYPEQARGEASIRNEGHYPSVSRSKCRAR